MTGVPPRTPYRPDIDGLRAVAIVLVLAFHIAPRSFPGGFVGVDVFFVISGFLITRILVADTEPGRFRRFYARRVRRLAPALAIVLASTLALGSVTLLTESFEQLARHVAAAVLFVANFVFWSESGYFDASAMEKPLLHLWSLGIEEQFYLLWPLTLVALQRVRRALAATLGTAAVSFAACVVVVQSSPESAFYLPWYRFWEPLAGAALALAPTPRSWPRALHEFLAWAGGLSIAGSAILLGGGDAFPSWTAAFPVLGTVMLITAGPGNALARWVLSRAPVIGLGRISYPLYLWHWPLIGLLADAHPVTGVVSRLWICGVATLLAVATHLAVERPWAQWASERPTATVALPLGALAVVAGVGLGPLSQPREGPPENPAMLRVERALSLDAQLRFAQDTRPCGNLPPEAVGREFFCRASGPPSPGPILLWGDSTAESWEPLVHAVAADRGEGAVALSFSGCPPLLGVRAPRSETCSLEDEAWKRDLIESLRPSHIVVSARWGAYVNRTAGATSSDLHFVTTSARGEATRETSRRALLETLPTTLDWLASLAPTTVIAAPPDLLNALPRAVVLGLEHGPRLAEHRAAQEPVARLLESVASVDPRVRILDPAESLCDDDRCSGIVDDTFVYLDDNHVSAQGALLFRQPLLKVMREAESLDESGDRGG